MGQTVVGRILTAAIVAIALGGAWKEQDQLAAQAIPPAPSGSVSATTPGTELFARTCAPCHGQAGVGNRAPALRGTKFTAAYAKDVVTKGRPGTMMSSFAQRLTSNEIDLVTNYVASLQQPTAPLITPRPVPATFGNRVAGDPEAGETAFFNKNRAFSCYVCHSVNGRGGKVGPDLARKLASQSPSEVFDKIIHVPHRRIDPAYATSRLTTKIQIFTGIRAREDEEAVWFYDARYLPPLLRLVKKSEILSATPLRESVMPTNYASRLSLKELLDLVAFLTSSAGGRQERVSLEDVVSSPTR